VSATSPPRSNGTVPSRTPADTAPRYSAERIRFEGETEFATLWCGATLPNWRRRGIYRATVTYRANLAAARGFRYLETDASDDSRPILERLGFTAVTKTTRYVWSPST
jgi:GNAT superfamily N-acetyltransferase